MKLLFSSNSLVLDSKVTLSPVVKKKDIITQAFSWEEWLKNDIGETVSYRLKLCDKKSIGGDIYIIATFKSPINDNSLLVSWFLSPEKLINGEQKKVDGLVTKGLRKWFFEQTGEVLPKKGDWGDIDASYDPWNQVGMIVCNYRAAFRTKASWEEYRKNNKF